MGPLLDTWFYRTLKEVVSATPTIEDLSQFRSLNTVVESTVLSNTVVT